MTTPPFRPVERPRTLPETPVELLMRVLQGAMPVAPLDLLLDRIEAAR
jgi:hypothetical protein